MLRGTTDAVSDLPTAESVYQVVKGNLMRSDGTMDIFSLC